MSKALLLIMIIKIIFMNILIKKMTKKQRLENFQELCLQLAKLKEDAQVKVLLTEFTKILDDLDQEDFLGTEGWKHYLNFE